MSRLVGKPTICIGENKDADQLRGNREADQHLCFRYWDGTIPLLLKSEISSFLLFSVLVQASLCRTCSETALLVFPRGGSYVWRFLVTQNNPLIIYSFSDISVKDILLDFDLILFERQMSQLCSM